MAESEEELQSLLVEVKEESEKAGLKLSIKKTKIMASSPSLHGKYIGQQWKQWQTLFSWAPKSLRMVTATTKLRHLLLGKKAMTNLDAYEKAETSLG